MSENPTWKILNPCWKKPTRKNRHGKSETKKEVFHKEELIIKKDIDNDGSAKPWESNSKYIAFRQLFIEAGADDIQDHSKHNERFKESLAAIGFSKLIEYAEKYIAENKENSQICWFLGGGWKNYLPKKATKKAIRQAGKLPKAVAEQLEAEKEQTAGSTLSEEEKEGRRRRILEKIRNMDAKLSASQWVKDLFPERI